MSEFYCPRCNKKVPMLVCVAVIFGTRFICCNKQRCKDTTLSESLVKLYSDFGQVDNRIYTTACTFGSPIMSNVVSIRLGSKASHKGEEIVKNINNLINNDYVDISDELNMFLDSKIELQELVDTLIPRLTKE